MPDERATRRYAPGKEEGAITVATGEFAVADHPAVLVTPALGSCVGIALWDVATRRGGLAHIMLPVPAGDRVDGRPDRFASLAIPRIVAQVTARGSRHRLVAKIAGGSAMFAPDSVMASIGERNVAEVKHQLTLLRIPLLAEDTGGGHARTMELYLDTGLVIVRSYRYGIREL